MYASDVYRKHNAYPTMNVERVYAVIAMCLELKTYDPALSDHEIITFVNGIFEKKQGFLRTLGKCVNLLPNSFQIAQRWNLADHDKRVRDGSLTYDSFQVTDGKIEYIFVIDRDAAIGTEGAKLAQEILENELVMGTDCYKNGNIVYLAHPAVWYTDEGGITVLDLMLQDLETELLK